MDGQTLITVVGLGVSGVIGVGGLATAFHSTRSAAKLARENRVEERRADAYLELLRIVESEGLWIDTRLQGDIVESEYSVGATRPMVAARPPIADQATANALVSSYCSHEVQESYASWRETTSAIEREYEELGWVWAGRRNHIEYADLKKLDESLVPAQKMARLDLAARISVELNIHAHEFYRLGGQAPLMRKEAAAANET